MNWYKIAQLLDETGVETYEGENSPKFYTDIGHGTEETVILWSWGPNGLTTVKATGLDIHDDYDELYSIKNAYTGRFVVNDKILSIHKWPRVSKWNIPVSIMQELKYEFNPVKVYIF